MHSRGKRQIIKKIRKYVHKMMVTGSIRKPNKVSTSWQMVALFEIECLVKATHVR